MKANSWVLDTLKDGYVLPFSEAPQRYEEPNNLSAISEMEFVRSEVELMIRQGVAKRVEEKPHCISPLTVAIKQFSEGTKKKRLCWDGSRHINILLEKSKVNLTHFHRALELVAPGDFQLKYDLKSAFHQVVYICFFVIQLPCCAAPS